MKTRDPKILARVREDLLKNCDEIKRCSRAIDPLLEYDPIWFRDGT